jgi:hypothetical protein
VLASGAYHLAKVRSSGYTIQRGRIFADWTSLITIDGGGEDVVLSSGEFRWFRPGTWLVM